MGWAEKYLSTIVKMAGLWSIPSHKLLSTPTHPKPATKPSTHSSLSEFPAKMGTSSESLAKMESVDLLDLTLPLEFNTPIL
ncbi:hypothetical protein Q8A67_024080 [Cirrhinus molitorella]|uniref:Uncharacterized protein n=1 Tax=Cirrhinus molitorella TaxID=172907 RepID=A0AA88TEU9_9TELE|nr:hypothetical protein Q8A67_024080 [Cirrhinus molitorella]